MKVALDTNVLAYAEGVNAGEGGRQDAARDLIDALSPDDVILPVQVLGELFNVLTRKSGRSLAAARNTLLTWRDAFPVADTTTDGIVMATDIATEHALQIWDAVILSTASEAGCRLLLSEDLQDGFTWGGVTVTNPFADPLHPLLHSLLADRDTSS